MNIERIDLNLLLALDALLVERNVTRAARRIRVSQPAMSHALARLRAAFGDPLFVRTSRGMLPTRRGEQLAQPLERALDAVRQVLSEGATFDPARSTRSFAVAMSEVGQLLLLPHLAALLAEHAPNARIVTRPVTPDTAERLVSGELDLLIGGRPPPGAGFVRRVLLHEPLTCVVRRGTRGSRLTAAACARRGRVRVEGMGADAKLEHALADAGLVATPPLVVDNMLIALLVVARSERVLVMGAEAARALGRLLPVVAVRPPHDLGEVAIAQTWHERAHHDPAHAWLRDQIARLCAKRIWRR